MISDISASNGRIGLQAEYAEIFFRNMEINEFEDPLPLENFIVIPLDY